jgi:hypothetical protein
LQGDGEEDVGSYWMNFGNEMILTYEEKALDRTMWRAHFGRFSGPVVRQTAK